MIAGMISFPVFYGAFAVFEMAIGGLFLLRGMKRSALVLVGAHLTLTALPFVLLPDTAWQWILAPTLKGQYIIKNILIAALAVVVGAHIRRRSANHTVTVRVAKIPCFCYDTFVICNFSYAPAQSRPPAMHDMQALQLLDA